MVEHKPMVFKYISLNIYVRCHVVTSCGQNEEKKGGIKVGCEIKDRAPGAMFPSMQMTLMWRVSLQDYDWRITTG